MGFPNGQAIPFRTVQGQVDVMPQIEIVELSPGIMLGDDRSSRHLGCHELQFGQCVRIGIWFAYLEGQFGLTGDEGFLKRSQRGQRIFSFE